jgi:hypothetical protein
MTGQDHGKLSLSAEPPVGVVGGANGGERRLDLFVVLQDHREPVMLTSRSSSFRPGFLALLLTFRRCNGRDNFIDQGHKTS